MSLILDALKKAQQESSPQTGQKNRPNNPIIPDKPPPSSRRFLILVLGLVISIGVLAWLRYLKKPAGPFVPQPIAAVDPNAMPQDPAQIKARGIRLYQENKLSEAEVFFEKLTLVTPTDAEVYNNLGLVLKKSGRKEEAYQAYNRALALQKDYPEALNNLGVLLLEDGSRERAKTNFQKAISLNKDYADPHFNLALVFEQEGNVKQARQNYRDFLDISPSPDKTLKDKIEAKLKNLEKR